MIDNNTFSFISICLDIHHFFSDAGRGRTEPSREMENGITKKFLCDIELIRVLLPSKIYDVDSTLWSRDVKGVRRESESRAGDRERENRAHILYE